MKCKDQEIRNAQNMNLWFVRAQELSGANMVGLPKCYGVFLSPHLSQLLDEQLKAVMSALLCLDLALACFLSITLFPPFGVGAFTRFHYGPAVFSIHFLFSQGTIANVSS